MSQCKAEPSFDDDTDFVNAKKGFIGTLEPCIIKSKDGRVVLNNEEYAFLEGECPATVNPKLWRQSRLCFQHGLFEVTGGIYQVRGLDLSNMTLVEGKSGVIVVDPLISCECAEAALGLYRQHRGDRPVRAVIFSHSHGDHFGGALGVLSQSSDGHYDIPIIAPQGFVEEALSENILAGPSMLSRGAYMYGNSLPKGPKGQVSCGLGLATSSGTMSFVPPNDIIMNTGEERSVDGVRIVFQMVPETEAPSEMNFYFPDQLALCIAECATHTLHNITTLRGALVRDAKRWSSYLDETITLYAAKSEVLFASHHFPTWGSADITKFISEQRDLYAYLHDQTLRLLNLGLNGVEIAEQMDLPPALAQAWHLQGFYGSVSHNVKGIYQRYMTWFDGNPANLWKHTPTEEGKRYVDCIGGVDIVVSKAKEFASNGDLRFAATLLNHAIAAEPSNENARASLADIYEQLGYGAENATWRNFYLTGAQDLRASSKTRSAEHKASDVNASLFNPLSTVADWLDLLSIRLDGPKANALSLAFVICIKVLNQDTCWALRLSNGALSHRNQALDSASANIIQSGEHVNLTITLNKGDFFQLLTTGKLENAKAAIDGDINVLQRLLELCSVGKSNLVI